MRNPAKVLSVKNALTGHQIWKLAWRYTAVRNLADVLNVAIFFYHSTILQRHLRTSGGETSLKCFHCDKHFAAKSVLLEHYMAIHRKTVHNCKNCGKHFKSCSIFKKHMCKRMKKIFTCWIYGEFCGDACGLWTICQNIYKKRALNFIQVTETVPNKPNKEDLLQQFVSLFVQGKLQSVVG